MVYYRVPFLILDMTAVIKFNIKITIICALLFSGFSHSNSMDEYHQWGEQDKHGIIGTYYYYDNPYNNDEEVFELVALDDDGTYSYFPIDKKNNKYWRYISDVKKIQTGYESKSDSVSGKSTNQHLDDETAAQTADIIEDKNNVLFVIDALLDEEGEITDYKSVSVEESIPAFTGQDVSPRDIVLPAPKIIIHNGSRWVWDWHCYSTDGLNVERREHKLYVNGVFSEYKFDMKRNGCSDELISEYTFNNAVLNEEMKIEHVDTILVKKEGSSTAVFIPTFNFVALAYESRQRELFGSSWVLSQHDELNDSAKELGNNMFVYEGSKIKLNIDSLSDEKLIDFGSLDKQQLLNGALWGMPGQGSADERWCRIVNIPDNLSKDTLKYQTVIATNCARSKERYCDGYSGHGFSVDSGIFPPVGPLAWDDATAADAQLNSDEQSKRDLQGHFHIGTAGQNAFVTDKKSAIAPIFGVGMPRTDGHINDAGKNSWTGHAGHCQNVMKKNHTRVGLGYADSRSKEGFKSYWTQSLDY